MSFISPRTRCVHTDLVASESGSTFGAPKFPGRDGGRYRGSLAAAVEDDTAVEAIIGRVVVGEVILAAVAAAAATAAVVAELVAEVESVVYGGFPGPCANDN